MAETRNEREREEAKAVVGKKEAIRGKTPFQMLLYLYNGPELLEPVPCLVALPQRTLLSFNFE
jgi:hypothetical protein